MEKLGKRLIGLASSLLLVIGVTTAISYTASAEPGDLTDLGTSTAGAQPESIISLTNNTFVTGNIGDNTVTLAVVNPDKTITKENFPTNGNYPFEVAFSPKHNLLVAANYGSGSLSLFGFSNSEKKLTFIETVGSLSSPHGLDFSPDESKLAVANGGNISVFDVNESGELINKVNYPSGGDAQSVYYSQNGKFLVASHPSNSTVSIFNVSETGVLSNRIDSNVGFYAINAKFSTDSKILAVTGWTSSKVKFFSVPENGNIGLNPDPVYEYTGSGGVQGISFSPDGNLAAISSTSGNAYLFSISNNEVSYKKSYPAGNGPRSLDFSKDGKILAAAGENGGIKFFSVEQFPSQELLPPRNITTAPDNLNQKINVSWDAPENAGDFDEIEYLLTESPDGKTATTSNTSYTFEGLSIGEHTFTVKARTVVEDQSSIESAPVQVLGTLSEVTLSSPTNFRVTSFDGYNAVLSWNAPDNASDFENVEYVVTESPDGKKITTSDLTATFNNLSFDKDHTFEIMAKGLTEGSSTQIFNFSSGNAQTFEVPKNGKYLLEVWGAEGGTTPSSQNVTGGKGGYSKGSVELQKGEILYAYVGGKGAITQYSSSGGGAADFRVNGQTLYDRIIVAGGGGGTSYYGSGGAGGGLIGLPGTRGTLTQATQTSAGSGGSFGVGAPASGTGSGYGGHGGGGSGWYGGGYNGSAGDSGGASGGSGYVLTENSYKPSGYNLNSNYWMSDAETIAGNQSFISPDGINEVGHSGNGYARITLDPTKYSNSVSTSSTMLVQSPSINSLSLTQNDYQNATVKWNVVNDGNSEITGYKLTIDGTTLNLPAGQTQTTIPLEPGNRVIKLKAVNEKGESNELSTNFFMEEGPGLVTNIVPSKNGKNITLSWDRPNNIPSSTSLTYKIVSFPAGYTVSSTSNTSVTFNNIPDGRNYQFGITAISTLGEGETAYTEPIDFYNENIPAPEWNYNFSNGGQIQLGWRVPIDNSLTVTNYILECSDLDNANYSKVWTLSSSTTDYNPQFDKLGLGDSYTCTVRIKNNDGIGKASVTTSEMIPYLAPDKVVNPIVEESSRTIDLSWTAPYDNGSAITKYTVNMTNLSTNESFNTTVSNETSHKFTNLVNGNRYQFLIYAINAAGTSPVVSITGTPRTTPSDARTATLTANQPGSASVTGSWKEAIDTGGAPVSYKVKLFNVTTGQYVYNTTTNSLQVTVGSLQWDNQYKLEVTATNVSGDSKNTIASNTVTVLNLPEKPGNVLAVAGIESATVTWTTPVTNGATITGYRISGVGQTIETDASTNSVTFENLNPAQQVRFTVTVLSDRGQGRAETTTLPGITIVGHPVAPRITNIKEGAYSLNASWTTGYGINATGNSAVTGYEVTLFDATDNIQSDPEIMTATNKQFTDLTPGHNYKVGVKVINAVGMSPQSQSGTVKPYGTPDPVKSVIAKKIDDYTAQVSFTPGFNNYDLAVYQIDAVNLQDNSVVMSKTIGSNTALFTNFPTSSAYRFVITAKNKAGNSTPVDSNVLLMDERTSASNQPGDGGNSGETNDPDKTPIVISEDVNWAVTAAPGNRSATLTFPSIENVTNYYITVINHTNPLNGGQVLKVSNNEVTVNNLQPLEEYSFTVIGLNSVSSTSEIESNTVTPYSNPDQPDAPNITGTDINKATINWTAPSSYGSTMQSYTVRGVSNDGGKTVSKNVTGATLSTTLEGLSSGRHYTFQILATNQYGSSKWSEMSKSVLISGIPNTPQSAIATSGNGSIKVSWSAPDNASITNVTSYTVTSNRGDTQTVSSSNAIFTNLTVGDSYSFTVYATNQYGNSATVKSNTVKFLTQPDAPGIAVAAPAPGSAFVEITPSVNTGGEPVEYYTVRAINLDNSANGGQIARVYNGAAIVNGLTNGDHYSFVVTATNSVGTSDPSIPSNIVVPLTGPVAKNAESDNTQLTVDWTGVFEQGSGDNYSIVLKDLTEDSSQEFETSDVTEFTTNVVLGLGHYYSFSIDNGSGERLSNIVMPYGAPGPVSNVVAVTNEISTLTATWNAATVTNGRNLQNYKVELYKEMGNVLVQTGTAGVNNRTITFNNLLADDYYVKVYAVNAEGQSEPVNSNTVTVYSLPTAPRMASIIPNDALVTTNWIAPVNTGGVTLNNYTVRLTNQTTGEEVTQWTGNNVDGFMFSHIFNELNNGDKYTFAVMTSNQFGDSDWSVESNYVIPGSYYSMELPPAALDLGNPDDTGMVNIYIESEITLTLSDDSVTLTEIPDMTTTETDNEMVYNVKTNSIAGFNVTLNSDSDTLSPSTQGNNETFDFSDVKAWNSESPSDDAISLSTDPGLIQSSDTKTGNDGQDFTTKFSAEIPWINADTYTGTVTYTATAN